MVDLCQDLFQVLSSYAGQVDRLSTALLAEVLRKLGTTAFFGHNNVVIR